jgi:hypothetical protein
MPPRACGLPVLVTIEVTSPWSGTIMKNDAPPMLIPPWWAIRIDSPSMRLFASCTRQPRA